MAEEANTTDKDQDTTPDSKADSNTTAEKQEKLVPQSEVDKLIDKKYAEWKSKSPADDELKAFKEWKKSQQSEAEKAAEREQEFAKLQSEAETLKRENMAIKAGVNNGDVDYVLFKVGKMEGEFADNLKAFLAENTKYTEPETTTVEGMKHKPPLSGGEDGVEAEFLKRNPGLKVE